MTAASGFSNDMGGWTDTSAAPGPGAESVAGVGSSTAARGWVIKSTRGKQASKALVVFMS
jgi:hypothetical protein